ncbi:hypothetical protein QTP88_023773 [Uroleucon formosanum]
MSGYGSSTTTSLKRNSSSPGDDTETISLLSWAFGVESTSDCNSSFATFYFLSSDYSDVTGQNTQVEQATVCPQKTDIINRE